MSKNLRYFIVVSLWLAFAGLLWQVWRSINRVANLAPPIEAMAGWAFGVGVIIAVILAALVMATGYLLIEDGE